ncbi:hypothetical protein BACOV975_03560 [Bacteroides ovatus V975]|nr:hypothetical protein BACOV975_03560 [Bacteroides ovatus V975]
MLPFACFHRINTDKTGSGIKTNYKFSPKTSVIY